ncbi:MAG: hypothetical protein CVV02_12835 [Firmicutes bacterium HGW-Firmicutes-7]|nr:MAG: hypothetical protein CVV02_12835 [Firmicutes bacterium HGW-Firmicutes-7]
MKVNCIAADWENPKVIEICKEKPHVESFHYSTLEQLKGGDNSSWRLDLNGIWHFMLSKNPSVRPIDFYDLNYDISSWQTIQVPGLWQLQGYDEENQPYFLTSDFSPSMKGEHVPIIDHNENAVGSYKKHFTISSTWVNREVFIHFGAVKSAFYIWINGERVGYSQGSMTPAEFDITKYLKYGEENTVSVEVYRYSDGTYLEGHNTWFLSGIYRDVYVYSEPKITIRDYFVSCRLDDSYEDAIIKIDVEVANYSAQEQGIQMSAYLAESFTEIEDGYMSECRLVAPAEGFSKVTMEADIVNPKKWTAETPDLYVGAIVLKNHFGQVITAKKFTFGFRSVEIHDAKLLINGKTIILKGINRHDFDPDTGFAVSEDRYEQDIKLLKSCNINAIRTNHYPNDAYFYDLCDQYGLYVMDEVDIETYEHDETISISNNPDWCKSMVDRMTRMVVRDRNHPSVIIWSLGNEVGHGENYFEMKKAGIELDISRPFHFEGDLELLISDFISKQNTSLEYIDEIGNDQDYYQKPALLCAYGAGRENGFGNLKMYMDKFEKYDNWCGGFIYDFADQAIRKNIDGENVWLYGRDFGEEKTSGYFCISGIVAADRSLHPTAYEVKKVYQGFGVKEIDLIVNMIEIYNKNTFINMNQYKINWELLEDGELLKQGALEEIDIEPGESKVITLPITDYKKLEGAEYHININCCLKENSSWGVVDEVIAWEQLKVPNIVRVKEKKVSLNMLEVHDRKIKVEVLGEGFSCRVSKLTGDVTSLIFEGKEYLISPLKLNFYRAATDNDLKEEIDRKSFISFGKINWKKVSESYKVQKVIIENNRSEVVIKIMRKVKHIKNSLITEYTIDGNGEIVVSHQLTPKKNLIKFGSTMEISNEFNQISWFGKGIHENYVDRQEGAKVGVYSCHINDYIHNYLRPQENSNRTDIRWFSATTGEGEGLFFEDAGKTLLNMSAWPYTLNDLDEAHHIQSIRMRNSITLNIDYKQKGVGLDETLQKKYQLKKNIEYKYGYKICRAF